MAESLNNVNNKSYHSRLTSAKYQQWGAWHLKDIKELDYDRWCDISGRLGRVLLLICLLVAYRMERLRCRK